MSGIRKGERVGAVSQDGDTQHDKEKLREVLGLIDPERPQLLPIKDIRRDGGTQPRAALDQATVQEYAEDMRRGDKFPPGIVFDDGTEYWMGRGFTRTAAAESLGWTEYEYIVKKGTQRDAILFSVGENAEHGQRRTNADKRRAVLTLLKDEEWGQWNSSEIARQCHVDEKTVRNLRDSSLTSENPKLGKTREEKRIVQRGDETYQMKPRKKIAKRPKTAPSAPPPEPPRNLEESEPAGQWQNRPAQPRGLYQEDAGDGWSARVSADKVELSVEIEPDAQPLTEAESKQLIVEHLRQAAEGLAQFGYEGEVAQLGDFADELEQEWNL